MDLTDSQIIGGLRKRLNIASREVERIKCALAAFGVGVPEIAIPNDLISDAPKSVPPRSTPLIKQIRDICNDLEGEFDKDDVLRELRLRHPTESFTSKGVTSAISREAHKGKTLVCVKKSENNRPAVYQRKKIDATNID